MKKHKVYSFKGLRSSLRRASGSTTKKLPSPKVKREDSIHSSISSLTENLQALDQTLQRIDGNMPDDNTSVGKPTKNGPEKFSVVYENYAGKIPKNICYDYTSYASKLMEQETLDPEQKSFVKDYLKTKAYLEADLLKAKEGINEIGRELIHLPHSSYDHTIKLSELVIKPDVFDGEKPRPRKWIQEYNDAIIANGWSNEIAIKYLPTFLSKSAKDWYFTEIKPLLKPETRWYQIYHLFVENYLGQSDYDGLSRAVENTRQRPGETISNFMPRLRRLLLLLTPGLPESTQLQHVKDKLRPEYKPLLAYSNPTTLRDLRECCLRIEAGLVDRRETMRSEARGDSRRFRSNNNLRRRSPSPRYSRGSRSFNRSPSRNQRRLGFSPNREGEKIDGRRPNPDIICYNCNKKGHVSKDCWARKASPSRSTRRGTNSFRRRVNFIQEDETSNDEDEVDTYHDEEEESDEEPVDEGAQVLTVQHRPGDGPLTEPRFVVITNPTNGSKIVNLVVGGGKLLEQKITCNDVEINAIVDTGAYVSVIDESIVEHFKWATAGPPMSLVGADGKPLKSKGTITLNLELKIGNITKRKKHTLAIVTNLTAPMLIGLELLRVFKICIDTNNSRLTFLKDDVLTGIRTARKELIPARTQMIIEGKVNTIGTILEVPFQLENGLMVANGISEVVNNTTPLMVVNPTTHQIELCPNTQLACYEPHKENQILSTEFGPDKPITKTVKLGELEEELKIGKDLSRQQTAQLMQLLTSYIQAFSLHGEIGKTGVFKHSIELLPNTEPFAEPLRRRAQSQIEETRRQVRQLIQDGIVEESSSPWASAYVLAKKKNGEYRLCIDFRKLNSMTKKVAYPLPNIDECLETLSGKKFFTQLDFKSGFWQIEMEEKSREYTAFRTEDGQFQFKRMPFGLTNAPASFQKMINTVLAGLKGMNLQVFIDDICIATKTWEEHLSMLESVFKLIIQANLKISVNKCVFGASSVRFLGHEISESGMKQDPDKLRSLRELPVPKDAKEVKRALGMFSYYRKFVPSFAMIVEPLTKLTRKGVEFTWGSEQQEAYAKVIQKLQENATLIHYNHHDPHLVKTDASRKGVAGMLLQKHGQDWKLVTCCSRRLSTSETNYGITDLEGLALVYTLTKLRPYLLGKPFKVLVDHCALCVLNKRSPASARLQRWAIVLSEFDFEIVYTKGNQHCDIDCLSRAPVDDPIDPYLEGRVYMVAPFDKTGWISQYADQESKDLYQKAYDREDNLRLVDEIIYKGDLLFVPAAKRKEIIRTTHVSNLNAHPGINATISKLKENYWWPRLREDVTSEINQCLTCQKQKPDRNRPGGTMHSFHIFQPGEQVAIDLIEKITESLNGNQFIIVAVDMFTRFVEAKAVPDKSAPTLTQFLVEYCGRYGVPHSVLTDNSTTFCNEFTNQVIKVFGAEHFKATPYHSQGNAVVERVNQTLEEKIRLVLDDPLQDRNWDAALPVAVLAINTAYHASLGCTPYEMTFGKRPPLQDKNLTFKATPSDLYAKLIQSQLKECHSNAIAIQTTSQERSKQYFENKRREVLFEIGDTVVIRSPSRSSKLAPKFLGPYKIVGKTNDVYTLEDTKNQRVTTRHVADLRKCVQEAVQEPTPAPQN